jgi:dihydroorotase
MILTNATIINESESYIGYVEIEGEKIVNVGRGTADAETLRRHHTDEIKDLKGKWLIPGVIDDQVHFRDPGLTHKADIATESRAAIAGGVTSFMDMPNTNPQTTTLEAWEAKMRRGSEASLANYSFFFGGTNDNIEEIKRLDSTRIPGIKVFLGASTGNMLVDKQEALQQLFSLPHLIAIHSEDEGIIRKNMEEYKARCAPENVPIECHPLIRSREACVASTQRAIALAQRLGTKLHVLHLSTAEEAKMMAEVNHEKITAEVCVHHLWFTDKEYATLGSRIKCNPAVKSEADREELRKAINDGRISVVATDHAPHLLSEKRGGALQAASGMPLVQFSLIAMMELAKDGVLTKEKVVELMCHNPAKLFKIENRGFIRKGYFADLAVIDPERGTLVEPSMLESRCGWSPFEGHRFPYSVECTFVNGKCVYDKGKFENKLYSKALKFNH